MDLREIGYFSKTHGVKGHLILKVTQDFYYQDIKVMFTEVSGSKAPHFISSIESNAKNVIVKLEELSKVEEAQKMIGKKVFVDQEFVDGVEEMDFIGYELIDRKAGSLGPILEVNDQGVQLLVTLKYQGKEVILPLVDELIESIDDENKKIVYQAPDGLIDMYLNP